MVQHKWDGHDHRHHGKIEYQRKICIHESFDKQAVSALGLPFPEKDENIQENQHYKIDEIFYQVLHDITSFHLPPIQVPAYCVVSMASIAQEWKKINQTEQNQNTAKFNGQKKSKNKNREVVSVGYQY